MIAFRPIEHFLSIPHGRDEKLNDVTEAAGQRSAQMSRKEMTFVQLRWPRKRQYPEGILGFGLKVIIVDNWRVTDTTASFFRHVGREKRNSIQLSLVSILESNIQLGKHCISGL